MTAVGFLFAGEEGVTPAAGVQWAAHDAWAVAERAARATGVDIGHLLFHAPASDLAEVAAAQLAAAILGLAARDALTARGVAASWHVGQGVGALAALAAAGAVSVEDAFRVVAARGAAMAEAHRRHPGATLTVSGPDDELMAGLCAMAAGGAWIARYDAPRHVTVAGTAGAVATVAGLAAAEGGVIKPVAVDVAVHCPLLAPAAAPLAQALASVAWSQPAQPVLSELMARPYPGTVGIPQVLAAEVCHPSRWRQAVARGIGIGPTSGPASPGGGQPVLVALGAGAATLAARAQATAPAARVFAVEEPEDADFVAMALDTEEIPSAPPALLGELLSVPERLVVSPAAGRFAPHEAVVDGAQVHSLVRAGQVLGKVGDRDVQSQFSGELMGMLAAAGERVTAGQPIAWIRS
ncbi:MAG TPA: acyltransferase domain-containing protein [Acidimicrobiales bacterium]|nr:acyltransferase domain-containing protein [Acidimicrobiales bacterium]